MRVLIATLILVLSTGALGAKKDAKDTYLEAYIDSKPQQSSEGVVYGQPSYGALIQSTFPTAHQENPKSTLFPQVLKVAGLVFKIILKITLFKLIVKFIAIICLMFFLPSLDVKGAMDEMFESDKGGKLHAREATLNSLELAVEKSLKKYWNLNNLESEN